MSADRDELIRLVRTVPDEQVSVILADIRKHVPEVTDAGLAYATTTAAEPSYWY